MKAMPTVIKLLGAVVALFGLIAKVQAHSARAEPFFSGFNYVVLVVGLALVVLGFAFNFFMNSEKNGTAPGRGADSKDRSSSAS